MSGSLWGWVVAGTVVVTFLGILRWELVDFLLDQFGSISEWWLRGRKTADSEP
jgi:hypothetical protein